MESDNSWDNNNSLIIDNSLGTHPQSCSRAPDWFVAPLIGMKICWQLLFSHVSEVSICLKAELDEASEALDAAHRLSEQLDRKEALVSALRDEGI